MTSATCLWKGHDFGPEEIRWTGDYVFTEEKDCLRCGHHRITKLSDAETGAMLYTMYIAGEFRGPAIEKLVAQLPVDLKFSVERRFGGGTPETTTSPMCLATGHIGYLTRVQGTKSDFDGVCRRCGKYRYLVNPRLKP